MADERHSEVRYDTQGGGVLTEAIRALLDRFPGLDEGERVAFATLRAGSGLAMFPGDGAVIDEEHSSVTGRVRQVCSYPLVVLYRGGGLNEQTRTAAKERLDALGRWLGRQSVYVDGRLCRLEQYPPLADGRRLLDFTVQSPACLSERDEHQTETWAIALTAKYENIFMRR